MCQVDVLRERFVRNVYDVLAEGQKGWTMLQIAQDAEDEVLADLIGGLTVTEDYCYLEKIDRPISDSAAAAIIGEALKRL